MKERIILIKQFFIKLLIPFILIPEYIYNPFRKTYIEYLDKSIHPIWFRNKLVDHCIPIGIKINGFTSVRYTWSIPAAKWIHKKLNVEAEISDYTGYDPDAHIDKN